MSRASNLISLCEGAKVVFKRPEFRGGCIPIFLGKQKIGDIVITYGDSGTDTYYYPEFDSGYEKFAPQRRELLGGRSLSYVKTLIADHVEKIAAIQEGKQTGIIYHITGIEDLWSILSSDKLTTRAGFICVTRNKYYKSVSGKEQQTGMVLTLDGDKLSNTYKIVPHRDRASGYGSDWEAEERIQGTVAPLSKYLLNIETFTNDPNDYMILRKYLAKHPHVTISSPKPIPPALSMANQFATIEGFWWKGQVYKAEEFINKHPHFVDWDGQDKSAVIAGAVRPEEVCTEDAVYVNVYNLEHRDSWDKPATGELENVRIDVWYDPANKTQAGLVSRQIKKRFPDYKVAMKAIDTDPYGQEDDDDSWDGRSFR